MIDLGYFVPVSWRFASWHSTLVCLRRLVWGSKSPFHFIRNIVSSTGQYASRRSASCCRRRVVRHKLRLVVLVRFQVLSAASIKTAACWDIAPWSLVEVNYFSEVRTASTIRVIALIMEAVRMSETSVYFTKSAWHCVPECFNLHWLF
jgi:hypothetical protein